MQNVYRPTWLEINLENVQHNCRIVRQLVGEQVKIGAVVKANAYGHGAVEVSKACLKAGAEYLIVATMGEAVELREAGLEAPILIIGYTPEECFEQAISYDVRLALYDVKEAQKLSEKALKLGKPVIGHLKVDTGMSRLGIPANEVGLQTAQSIMELDGIQIEGIFSHFSKADETDKTFSYRQLERFRNFVETLEQRTGKTIAICHMAASAGLIDVPEGRFNMVRPGIILYGHQPSAEMHHMPNVKPVLSWKARLGRVEWLPGGQVIGYNGTYELKQDTLVATVPVGYADGYNRLLSNRGYVLCQGKRLPIIGRVCMDYFMVDATALPDLKIGDEVVLLGQNWGESITVPEMADMLHTIVHEVTCNISLRVPRKYLYDQMELQEA